VPSIRDSLFLQTVGWQKQEGDWSPAARPHL
jgi:hypothetical protein